MKHFGRICLSLAIVMCCLIGIAVNAQAATTVAEGNLGDDLTWTVTSDGVLTISGTGAIPDYYLGYSPFYNTVGVKSVVIESGVTSIGTNVFACCWDLTSVTIPSTVKSINANAFLLCSSLKTVTIPKNVKTIGDMAFFGCYSMTAFKVNSSNSYFSAASGVLFNKDKTTLIQAPGALSGAYSVPGSVTKIKDYAFASCCLVTSVTIPKSVAKIGSNVFTGTSNLKKITVNSSNEYYSNDSSGVLFNKKKTTLIHAPAQLKGAYTIPAGVRTIAADAFFNCLNMTAVTLPATLTTIKDYAFENCIGISEITFPKKVTSIGAGAFSGCEKLNTITFEGNLPDIDDTAFTSITATVFYPHANKTWTGTVAEDESFGGYLMWYKDNDLIIDCRPDPCIVEGNETKAVFSVYAIGKDLTYQWQYRESSSDSWKNATSSTANTRKLEFTAKLSHHGREYRCKITNGHGITVYTEPVYLYLLKITAQSEEGYAVAGNPFQLSVSAIGKDITYQWQYKSTTSKNWKNVKTDSAQKATCTLNVETLHNNFQYRCVIEDDFGHEIYSDVVVLKVFGIKTQPKTGCAANGAHTKVSVSAIGDGLQYQWYVKEAGGTKYVKSSVTTATYSCKMTAKNDGRYVRCRITDQYGNSAWTKTVRLWTQDLAISTQPANKTAEDGTKVQFKVTPNNANVTYQWQYRKSADGTWKNASAAGNKTATLTVDATYAKDGYQYRCRVTDSTGNKLYTNAATLYMIGIETQPQNRSAPVGKNAKFTVKAIGSGLTYQWQYYKRGSGVWKDTTSTGYNTDTLYVPVKEHKEYYEYRCKITSSTGYTIYTKAATLRIYEINSGPNDVSTKPNRYATFYILDSSSLGFSYQWQYRTSSTGSWKNVSDKSGKTDRYTMITQSHHNGYQYRCKITDTSGNVIYSKIATLTVK